MFPIKLILIILSFIISIVYLKFFRSGLIDKAIIFFLFTSSCIAIKFPELTTTIAQLLGVGRGTDLIFYTFFFYNPFLLNNFIRQNPYT